MRPLTYILGAIAGFFTFGGLGLIYYGYQIEGGNNTSYWIVESGAVYTVFKGGYEMNKGIDDILDIAKEIASSLLNKGPSDGKNFPSKQGVYLIYQKNKGIIWVGRGKCLYRRINDDHISGEFKFSTSSFQSNLSKKYNIPSGPKLREWIIKNCIFACKEALT